MNYKLVALDLDRTLLNSNKEIDTVTRDTISRVQELGCEVVIVTGRIFPSAVDYARQLKLTSAIVTHNGALSRKINGKIISQHPIPGELSQEVVELAENHGLHLQVYLEDDFFFRYRNKLAEEYENSIGVRGQELGRRLTCLTGETVHKLLVIEDDSDRWSYYKGYLQKFYGHRLNITSSTDSFIEIMAAGVNKGQALADICQEWGYQQSEVVAIGDNYNDSEMLEWAKLGIAMANAPEEVRSLADRITSDNDNQGVARALDYLFLADEETGENKEASTSEVSREKDEQAETENS